MASVVKTKQSLTQGRGRVFVFSVSPVCPPPTVTEGSGMTFEARDCEDG